MNETGPRPSEVNVITDLTQGLAIAEQFNEDAMEAAESNDTETAWDTASLAGNLLESMTVVLRKPEIYDLHKAALLTVSSDGKVVGLGFVAVSHDHIRETFDFEGERVSLPHVESIGAVMVGERGWNALKVSLESMKLLRKFGVTRFLMRVSPDSGPVIQKYFERGLLKEFTPIHDSMNHYLVSI